MYIKWPRDQTICRVELSVLGDSSCVVGWGGGGGEQENEEWLPAGRASSKTDRGDGCATLWINQKQLNCTWWERELHRMGISSIKLLDIRKKGNEIYNQWSPNFTLPKAHWGSWDKCTLRNHSPYHPYLRCLEMGLRTHIFFFFLTNTPFGSDTLRAIGPSRGKSVIASSWVELLSISPWTRVDMSFGWISLFSRVILLAIF